MIDLEIEKQSVLTSQDRYDILNFALQAAENNGFINSFVFERAIYLYAAICFYPDRKQEISNGIAQNLLDEWDALVEDGTIKKMNDEHFVDMNLLADYGSNWYDEYSEYAHSARGLLDSLQMFSSDIMQQVVEQFQRATSNENLKTMTSIAEDWGMTPANAS